MDKIYKEINKKKLIYDIIRLLCFFAIIGTAAVWVWFTKTHEGDGSVIVLAAIIGVLLAIIWVIQMILKGMASEFKIKYVKMIYHREIKNSKYEPDEGLNQHMINDIDIFPYFAKSESDDLIKGSYNGINYISADVNLFDKIETKYGDHYKSFFKGRVYQFDFNKRFKQNLVLVQKKDIFGNHRPGNIKTESILFNSEFRVFSESEEEGFYILTPHIMEKLLYLDNKYKDRIMFSFNNNKLYIVTYGKSNPLDFRMFVKIDDSFVQGFIDEFNDIVNIIEVLQLEKDIFM